MKTRLTSRFFSKAVVVIAALILPLLLFGCLITTVNQTPTVEVGGTFTTTVTITDMNAEAANAHKGVIAVLVPQDWTFVSGTYVTTMGNGNMVLDNTTPPLWGDVSTNAGLAAPTGMKWINLLSDQGYLHGANETYTATLNLQVGQTTGTFNIGYIATVNTTDMLGLINGSDTDNGMAGLDTSMNHRVVVTPVVPVELTSFAAVISGESVVLNWETATETNNRGFEVERSIDKVNFNTIGFVTGKGTVTEKTSYSFVDKNVTESKLYYRLRQVDNDGTFSYSSIVEVENVLPSVFSISQNYPNPFNPSTSIKFGLPVDSKVKITIYNSVGEMVQVLAENTYSAGMHSLNVNASELSSGTYIYTISAEGADGTKFSKSNKMILMK